MRISIHKSACSCVAIVALSLASGCQNEDPSAQDGQPIVAVGQSKGEISHGINKDYKLAIVDDFSETINGVKASISFVRTDMAMVGTVENTTEIAADSVTIEIKLSNEEKLGPTTLENIAPGEKRDVKLTVTDGAFNRWTVEYDVTGGDPAAVPVEDDSSDDAAGDGSGDGDSAGGNSDDGNSDDGNSDDGNSTGGL